MNRFGGNGIYAYRNYVTYSKAIIYMQYNSMNRLQILVSVGWLVNYIWVQPLVISNTFVFLLNKPIFPLPKVTPG